MLVCVGIPAIDGRVVSRTVDSLLAETLIGAKQGVYFYVMWEIGCSLIGVARNKLARRFLETKEADCLVFVDADISWKGGELARLAKQPHDVIGGTYRAKTEDEKFHIRGNPEWSGDLLKVDGLPTGFLKISRSAFQQIPAATYTDDAGRVMRDYFPIGIHDGQMWGEDYGFCRLWREAGGAVLLDPSLILRHHDGLRTYSGDPLDWLNRMSDKEAA